MHPFVQGSCSCKIKPLFAKYKKHMYWFFNYRNRQQAPGLVRQERNALQLLEGFWKVKEIQSLIQKLKPFSSTQIWDTVELKHSVQTLRKQGLDIPSASLTLYSNLNTIKKFSSINSNEGYKIKTVLTKLLPQIHAKDYFLHGVPPY